MSRAVQYNGDFNDPDLKRKFGNLTATSTSEVLVSTRPYNEQAAQAQRSVKSTSPTDSDSAGTGARVVRITYLDTNYVEKTEDVALNGTTAVATVATDIRFIQNFEVIKGAEAVGAVELWTNTNGTGTAICGIGAASTVAFLCHYYVPAGKTAYVVGWGTTSDDECNMKLIGQARPDGTNLVNRVFDLEKLFAGNPTPPNRLTFERSLRAVVLPEKTYVRVTVVPNQSTSTVVRSWMYILEDS